MGTPQYAAVSLEAILQAGHEVVAVVTQPDRPKGRSAALLFTPVKEIALAHQIPVLTPRRVKHPDVIRELRAFEADIFVVAAYGQILSKEILEIPKMGCYNIHASLLPRYRGASPIQHAILNGDESTGISIMCMDEGIDTGDVVLMKEEPIGAGDTAGSLGERLAILGGEAIVEVLARLEGDDPFPPTPQDPEHAIYAPLLQKSMGLIDFSQDAVAVERHIRAMDPWPSAYAIFRGKQMKLWEACAVSQESEQRCASVIDPPGTIFDITSDSFYVSCGSGALTVTQVQVEGKRRMSVADFLKGASLSAQSRERLYGK
jgi:methionyl-tRNA formyltransferase